MDIINIQNTYATMKENDLIGPDVDIKKLALSIKNSNGTEIEKWSKKRYQIHLWI